MDRKEEIKARLEKPRPTRVFSYIHGDGRIGVLLEIQAQTDFALKTDLMQDFAKEVMLQIAALNPVAISSVSEAALAARMHIVAGVSKEMTDKPEKVRRSISEGKANKWAKTNVLLEQEWVKDSSFTVGGLLSDLRENLGEEIEIVNFSRFGR